ncbi:MarR family winged helix-turn-helix transcriptional regulator [Marmoricola sp. URHB0036]|uniref:MarR family winged helix-turn-helix transcriptional regulator n=1 Tax=Marmoricola sp. URHB0036 TaxID=1298863 RepID=UPI0003FFAF3B|nr:MarR family transcriptional regulator [Marmoricola sp. URHB0036]
MDSDDGPGPQLRARLGYLLKHAFFELEELHSVHLARGAVNVRELSVLLLLDGREPESQQQAAGRLGVDRTTMVGLLDGLEGKGLLSRQPDPADRRRNVVVLTSAGRRALKDAKAASDRAERELLADLSSTEARQLRALLARIVASSSSPAPSRDEDKRS